jgi:hypothetical protein
MRVCVCVCMCVYVCVCAPLGVSAEEHVAQVKNLIKRQYDRAWTAHSSVVQFDLGTCYAEGEQRMRSCQPPPKGQRCRR